MVQSLLLLVSELVTNAVRHAGAVTALWLTADRRASTSGSPTRARRIHRTAHPT